MITVETDIFIPECWHELTQTQAIETLHLLEGYFKREYDLSDFRLLLLKALTGYKPDKKKYKPEVWEQITFNLFTLSEMLLFPLKPHYNNPELLEVLPDDLQSKLQTTMPIDITHPDDIQQLETIASLLDWEPVINLDMHKNIIEEINGMPGPTFNMDEYGVITTDMIAAEYIDAYDFFNLYRQTRSAKYLDSFLSVLYRPNRNVYSTYEAQKRAPDFERVDKKIKNAVYVWFQSFLEYLYERSDFTWLFNHTPSPEKGISLGLSNSIYQLASLGYGTKTEVEMFPLQDYLSIQKKELVEAIKSMKDMDVKQHDIEKKTGLSAEIIAQI